jgi:RHS repeat-associated protein
MTIAYNHLNLPKLFTFANGAQSNTIEVLYDAAGTKLRKTVKTGSTVNYVQDYIGGIEYRDGAREAIYTAIPIAIGRVFYNSGTPRYEYSINPDSYRELGNARLTFTDKDNNGVVDVTNNPSTNEILQENHYYPFGLNTEGPWMNDASLDNRYQYNGKELNDDFGLNLYAYGARFYDPSLGRFIGVDPIADQFAFVTTYNYAENEPVANVDLWGLQKVDINDVRNTKGQITSRNASVSLNVKVLNLSSKDNYSFNNSLSRAGGIAERSFSTKFNAEVLDSPQKGLTSKEVPINVKFNLTVEKLF